MDQLPAVADRRLSLQPGRLALARLTPLARREARQGLLFISPWILGFLLFTLFPMIATLAFTFLNITLAQEEPLRFVGLDNYARLAADDRVWQSLAVTFKFAALWLPVSVLLPFFIAIIITIMNPRYMDPLYNTSTGHKLIATGLAAMCFGTVVLDPRTPNAAREIVFDAGLPAAVSAHSVSNYCISGIRALTDIADMIALGRIEAGIAAGADSMSNPPLLFRRSAVRVPRPRARHRTPARKGPALCAGPHLFDVFP